MTQHFLPPVRRQNEDATSLEISHIISVQSYYSELYLKNKLIFQHGLVPRQNSRIFIAWEGKEVDTVELEWPLPHYGIFLMCNINIYKTTCNYFIAIIAGHLYIYIFLPLSLSPLEYWQYCQWRNCRKLLMWSVRIISSSAVIWSSLCAQRGGILLGWCWDRHFFCGKWY